LIVTKAPPTTTDPVFALLLSPLWFLPSGTANTLDPITTQVGIFAQAAAGRDLSSYSRAHGPLDPTAGPFKVAFDGCGVTNGLGGTLFASGLEGQCDIVVSVVEGLIAAGARSVLCNCLGLSRGGLALMILAQKLGGLAPDIAARVELNMCLFDPVPGNLVSTGFPFTGFGRADLTSCSCLKRVLAIYPHEPLPDLSFHAPVLCKYPVTTMVEEDVTLGCHQGALFQTRRGSQNKYALASNLSFRMISDWFQAVGGGVDVSPLGYYQPSAADCLEIYRRELAAHLDEAAGTGKAPCTRRALHDGCVAFMLDAARGSAAVAGSSRAAIRMQQHRPGSPRRARILSPD